MEKQKLSLQPLRDRARLEDESAPARRRPIFDASSARKRGREAVAKSPLRDLETSLSLRPPSRSSLFDIITRIYSSHIRIAGIDSPPFLNLPLQTFPHQRSQLLFHQQSNSPTSQHSKTHREAIEYDQSIPSRM